MPSTPAIRVPIVGEDKTARAIRSAERNIKGLGKTAKAVFGAMGLGIGVSVLTRAVADAIQYGSALTDVADKLGVGVEALQEWNYAAEQNGVSSNAAEMGLQRFTRRLAEAAQGTGELKGVLEQYNISATNADGTTRDVWATMGDLANTIKNTEDPAERLRIAFKAFDSEGAALVSVLKKGSAGLDEWRDSAQGANVIMSEFDARNLDALSDAMAKLNTQFKVLVGGAVSYWSEAFQGNDPWVAQANAAAEAYRANLTPAMEAAFKAQDNLTKARKEFALQPTIDALQKELDYRKQIVREEEKQLAIARKRAVEEKGILAHIAGMYKSPMAGKSAEDLLFDEMMGMTQRGGTSASSATKAASTAGPSFPGLSGSGSQSPFFQNTESARSYMDRRYHSGSLYKRTMEDRERAAGTLPGSGLSGAADSITTSVDSTEQLLEQIVKVFQDLETTVETLQQQIGNAR